ncbi:MAG TPA: phage major capsid protein [Nannocystis exedens]|nr:phage major capsid protein [Nannocystis exedens]
MPFTSQEITAAGKAAIDFYQRNKLVDNYNTARPLLKKLKAKQKPFPGGKQYVVEQLRKSNTSNFQWFNGSTIVTYNKRRNIEQAQFEWRSAHDGFALDEDRLIQNGITIDDDKPGQNFSKAEKVQLTNLLDEEVEALGLGFEEKFDQALHLDGTQSSDAVTGLDALISLTPATGTVGGIDASANGWWRNHAATGLTTATTTGDILDKMEIAWRACIRNGGMPDFILAGSDFVDGLRNFMLKTFGRVNFHHMAEKGFEAGAGHDSGVDTGLKFHNVPIIWDPVFADLDTLYSPATAWEKRCYFLNTNHLRLRPVEGQDMKTRKPPRAYDKYEYYWGLTWRGSLCTNRRNAHAVLAIA